MINWRGVSKQSLDPFFLWESTAAYTLAMRQDQKECRELAGMPGFCSVPKDTRGVGDLRWPLVCGSDIAPMKLPDRSNGHQFPYIPKDGSPRDKGRDAFKGCDWSLVGKGNSRQAF